MISEVLGMSLADIYTKSLIDFKERDAFSTIRKESSRFRKKKFLHTKLSSKKKKKKKNLLFEIKKMIK